MREVRLGSLDLVFGVQRPAVSQERRRQHRAARIGAVRRRGRRRHNLFRGQRQERVDGIGADRKPGRNRRERDDERRDADEPAAQIDDRAA